MRENDPASPRASVPSAGETAVLGTQAARGSRPELANRRRTTRHGGARQHPCERPKERSLLPPHCEPPPVPRRARAEIAGAGIGFRARACAPRGAAHALAPLLSMIRALYYAGSDLRLRGSGPERWHDTTLTATLEGDGETRPPSPRLRLTPADPSVQRKQVRPVLAAP